jgi:cyclase
MSVRVIPCLLLKNNSLVKTIKFKNETYIGDPINAIRIFNDKEVDELVILDISASRENKNPNYELIMSLASECFMPFSYGGGVNSIDQIEKLNSIGVEKVIINSAAFENEQFIIDAVKKFGQSSIVLSIDVKRDLFGNYSAYILGGTKKIKYSFLEILKKANEWQVGEVIINCINRDGEMKGYDEQLLELAVKNLNMPLVALGGAGSFSHLESLIRNTNISAVAAGSLFVYYGPHKAVLINYPSQAKLKDLNKIYETS